VDKSYILTEKIKVLYAFFVKLLNKKMLYDILNVNILEDKCQEKER